MLQCDEWVVHIPDFNKLDLYILRFNTRFIIYYVRFFIFIK